MSHQQQPTRIANLRTSPPTPMEPKYSASPYPSCSPAAITSLESRHRSIAISIPYTKPVPYLRLGQLLPSPSSASSTSSLSSLTSPLASVSMSPKFSHHPKIPSLHQMLANNEDDMDVVPTQSEPLYYSRPFQSKSSLSPPAPLFPVSPLLVNSKIHQYQRQQNDQRNQRLSTASPPTSSLVYSPRAMRTPSPSQHQPYSSQLTRKRIQNRAHSSDNNRIIHNTSSSDNEEDEVGDDRPSVIRRRSSSSAVIWQRSKPLVDTARENESAKGALPLSPITKPRWQDIERQQLFEAIVKDKQLDDMSTYRWDKIAELVGRPKKACKDQWRREVLPALRKNLRISSHFQQDPEMSDLEA